MEVQPTNFAKRRFGQNFLVDNHVIDPALTARVVANLPYNIGTAILQRLIEQRTCITEMVLMLQREVADRVMAPADSLDRGYFSVFVEAYCEVEKLFDVSPQSFR